MTNAASKAAESYKQLKKLRKDYQKKLGEIGTDIVEAYLESILVEHPEVKMVGWVQYTPYFNDGDPCTFRTSSPEMIFQTNIDELIKDEEIDPADFSLDEQASFLINEYNGTWEEGKKIRNSKDWVALDKLVDDDDLMLELFGDPVVVYATLNTKGKMTLKVVEYEHG